MKQQCVKIIKGLVEAEKDINAEIKLKNQDGWVLKSISNHFGRESVWCLLFEKTK